ncbi:6001_t:CDS:2, partial [Dentiscutata erythropus]
DNFNDDKALSSNDENSQEEDSDYTYNPTLEMIISISPSIDRQLSQKLPKDVKATDKILSKISYCTSATLGPLNYSLKTLYNMKPAENKKEALEVWAILEQSLLAARSLLLDFLSYTTQVKRDLTIKAIIPSYQPRAKHEELFGEELADYVKKEMKFQNSLMMLHGKKEEAEVEDSIGNLEPQVIGKIFGQILYKEVSLSPKYKYKKSPDYRYIATSVERIEALNKPFLDINTQSFKQSNSRESDDNSNFSFVANGTLVLYLTLSSSRSPSYNFTKLNYSQLSEIEQEDRTLESLYSVFIRKHLSNKSLQEGDINLFSAAYDPKASKTVSSNIRV